jgi:PTH1 family peptidyl-tRNA hydrolase
MNESGHAVARLKAKLKVAPTKVWLVHDDKDIELGAIKVKETGGSAGHHGVDSVIEQLKTKSFRRYRLGILPPGGADIETEKFVLAKFLPEEEPTIRLQVDKAASKLVDDLGGRS